MFVRIRWFVAGVAAALSGVGYLMAQVRKARQKLTAANIVAAGKNQAAAWLDTAAERLAPDDAGHRRR
ncbi:hypothetical protein ACFLRH_01545 [Actinomycetota bacterium]